jgi:glucans biosynthesis protein
VISVEASLIPRNTIKRIGIAPITSMYQHGENDHRMYNDFRPEVHDSDGLAILRGNGERIWRPLVNPPDVRVNAYADENPRGFGALQRDRDFTNYQDDGIYYNRRPNLWVEPQGQWGRGAVYLIEIPANEEIFDNIVAFWTPEEAPQPGREIRLAYNLNWGRGVPDLHSPVGRVIATRSGIGGVPGQEKGRDTQKFVIDFKGGPLELLSKDARVEAVISTSRGSIVNPVTRSIRELGGWRTNFDLKWEGKQSADLRCYLRLGTSALTETWSYQWTPPR